MAQPGMDLNYQQIVSSQLPFATSLPSMLDPAYQSVLAASTNNPFAPAAIEQAQNAGAAYYGLANMAGARGNNMFALGDQAMPYAQQILQTGFDPQQALYDHTLQQVRDQTNAQLAANNQLGTPYGAGIAADALANFNLNWQDRQLGRQNTATQGYGSLTQGIGRNYAGGVDLFNTDASALMQSGMLPYSTYVGQQRDTLGLLGGVSSGYGNALSPGNQVISNLLPYMQLGQNASALGQRGQMADFNQSQQLGQGFGQSLSQLGNSNVGSTVSGWFNSPSSSSTGWGTAMPVSPGPGTI
jgi:hypothetical protein